MVPQVTLVICRLVGFFSWDLGNIDRVLLVLVPYIMENLMKHWGDLSLNDREGSDC